MAAYYICIHLLYPHRRHFCVQMRIFLPPRHVLLHLHYRQTTGHAFVESTEGPPYPRVQHPGLWTKQEVRLKCRLVKIAEGPEICPLLPQSPGEMCPSTRSLPKIINHRRTVIIRYGKDPSKVFKCRHSLQRSHVVPEGHFCALLSLILPHTIEFPLCPLGTYHCGMMFPVHEPPGKKNIVFGQYRRGWLPSSSTTSMSRNRRYMNWTMRALQIVPPPLEPPTVHVMSRAVQGKQNRNIMVTYRGWGGVALRYPWPTLWCICRWVSS